MWQSWIDLYDGRERGANDHRVACERGDPENPLPPGRVLIVLLRTGVEDWSIFAEGWDSAPPNGARTPRNRTLVLSTIDACIRYPPASATTFSQLLLTCVKTRGPISLRPCLRIRAGAQINTCVDAAFEFEPKIAATLNYHCKRVEVGGVGPRGSGRGP